MKVNVTSRACVSLFIIGFCYMCMYPLSEKINLGLDLKGGMMLTLEVDLTGLDPEKADEEVIKALQIIRNRIDQFGVSSPSVVRQGRDKIVIELPGIKDPERAKGVVGKTALLEFRLVEDKLLDSALNGRIPKGYELMYEYVRDKLTGALIDTVPYLVEDKARMTGDALDRAWVSFDPITNSPNIGFQLKTEGAREFGLLTSQNVGRSLAIILDGVIQSAPNIQGAIMGGNGVITGRFSIDEARDLAVVLNAGALPTEVRIIEERAVGPSLGLDSIQRGMKAVSIGFLLVVVFMIVRYKFSGLIATVAVLSNIIIILGMMSLMNGTLTLPGIAGILLTVGMAVDANVLIYERIKEELRIGRTLRTAIEEGFSRAFVTIVDANVTTIITAVVLYKFGVGPVRGFAVTLFIGIVASMFTSLYMSKMLFSISTRRSQIVKLSI